MSRFWQKTQDRAFETQGVWALSPLFAVGGVTMAGHAVLAEELLAAATAEEDARNVLDRWDGTLAGEYDFFYGVNVAVGMLMGGLVGVEEGLRRDVDAVRGMQQRGRTAVEARTLRTVACWQKVNAWLAAGVPALPPMVVRGTAVAAYEDRWKALPEKRKGREDAAGDLRKAEATLREAERRLDAANKAWHAAWKSEFPRGTPERDALAGVRVAQGQRVPDALEIAAVEPVGLSLRVSYVKGTGKRATTRELIYQTVDDGAEPVRVKAEVAAGNGIGPFVEGARVRLWTEVKNSRGMKMGEVMEFEI